VVSARAGVSQRAFGEVFESVEECFLAAFEQGLARLSGVVEQAAAREQRWADRVRAGLVELLGFLDDERGWARVLFCNAPVDSAVAFRCEQRVMGVLTVLMDDGSPQAVGEVTWEPQLTGEFVVGGVFSVIRSRILAADGESLVEMAPSLMSFIATPYLGQAVATAELAGSCAAGADALSREAELSGASPIPVTRRTTLVLSAIASSPRSSNREVAAAAGLGDEGQTSHLLRRLARRGLIEKVTPRSGSRRENAWLLTSCGRRVLELLSFGGAASPHAPASGRVRQAA